MVKKSDKLMVKDRYCPSDSDIIIISNQSMEKENDDVFRKKRPGSEKESQARVSDLPSEPSYNYHARAAGASAGV